MIHDDALRRDLLNRLSRIEGQVRGISRMVEGDASCIDVLTQESAASRALERVALRLLEDHLRNCLAAAARSAGTVDADRLQDVSNAIARLVRS